MALSKAWKDHNKYLSNHNVLGSGAQEAPEDFKDAETLKLSSPQSRIIPAVWTDDTGKKFDLVLFNFERKGKTVTASCGIQNPKGRNNAIVALRESNSRRFLVVKDWA